jgi:hypothetical protein
MSKSSAHEPVTTRMNHITSMKMKRLSVLFALTSVVLSPGTTPTCSAQTNATAPGPIPTQVVILGTLHGSHKANTNYSLEVLRKIIVAVKPAATLVEQPPRTVSIVRSQYKVKQ